MIEQWTPNPSHSSSQDMNLVVVIFHPQQSRWHTPPPAASRHNKKAAGVLARLWLSHNTLHLGFRQGSRRAVETEKTQFVSSWERTRPDALQAKGMLWRHSSWEKPL
jgi:hypothetical protein